MKTLILLSTLLALPAMAETKFNPYSGEYETTTPNAQLEFNPYTSKHEYVPQGEVVGSKTEFNPYSGQHDTVPVTKDQSPTDALRPSTLPTPYGQGLEVYGD
jgi:hypothetical protein